MKVKYTREQAVAHALRELELRFMHGDVKYPPTPWYKRYLAKLKKELKQNGRKTPTL